MKKLFLLIIAIAFIFMGCVTTDNQVSGNETSAYRPQYNMFEENDWISISDVQLYQDEASLYLYISYDSDSNGKYSIFNPPSGNAFKLMGDLTQGAGTILQSIDKDSLNGIEGMTVLLYSGDYSNESTRVGFIVKSEEIRLNQIPEKPESIMMEQPEPTEDSSSHQEDNTPVIVEQRSEETASVWSIYDISPDNSYNTELKISIEGLDNDNPTLNFNQVWTNEKNQSRVSNLSPTVQGSEATYRFNIIPAETEGRIGIDVLSESEDISSFLLDVTPGKGNEYVIRYITANVSIQIQGDLDNFNRPMFITNRGGVGTFPRKAYPISERIEIKTMIPTYYPKFNAVTSTCELFDDLNGDGIYDYREEPIISNSININLDHPESGAYVLKVEN